jgi:hypothetical protein
MREIGHNVFLWGISADRGARLWFEGSMRTASTQSTTKCPIEEVKNI